MEMLQSMAGVKLVAVHYKGATPALTDVMAGHVQMMFISTSSAIEPWKAGKTQAARRWQPSTPATISRATDRRRERACGLRGGVLVRAVCARWTPRAVVELLNAEVRRVFKDPEFQEKVLTPNMFEPMVSSPEQFSSFIQSEAQKWGDVVRKVKVKLD